jgi:hypothetical protein
MQLAGCDDILQPFIRNRVSCLMQFHNGSISIYASDFVHISENVMKTLAKIRQAFGEESVSNTRVFEWKIPNSPELEMVRHVKSNANSMLIIFIYVKRIVHNEFVLAEQTVNFAYCYKFLRLLVHLIP